MESFEPDSQFETEWRGPAGVEPGLCRRNVQVCGCPFHLPWVIVSIISWLLKR